MHGLDARRLTATLAAALLALSIAAPAAALTKTSATWTKANPGPLVFWEGIAFAPTTCRLVTFGGSAGWSLVSGTSLFDPVANSWSTVAVAKSGPVWRANAAMAWNPVMGRVVMFGGRGSGRVGALQDTWAFDASARTWSPLVTRCRTGTCPPARWGGGMVWSTKLNKLVLFGGVSSGYPETYFDDLWTFDGAWKKVSVSGTRPSGRFLFGMAEDAATGRIVLYGGARAGITSLNDTWLLDPATLTWTKVATATTPPAYGEVAMGWSPSVGAVVQTGGSDVNQAMVTNPGTWAFDSVARTWVRLTTSGVPSPRKGAALVADTCHGSAILFGGEDGKVPPTFTDRTWILR